MAKEVAVHSARSSLSLPRRSGSMGSITTGEYTWGSFMRVVSAQSDVGGNQVIAGKDTDPDRRDTWDCTIPAKGGKAFSRLRRAGSETFRGGP